MCSQLRLPQFLVGVAAGLSRVQDLELSEDKGNYCSTGIGVKWGLKRLLFFGKISSLSQSCTCTVSMVSTDITEGFPEQNSHITGRDADMPGQPSCVSFFSPAHFQRGENERNHASYQNNGKTCYAENQIPDIKTLSVTIHGINIIHSLKNSGDNLRLACPSCISD